MKFIQKLKRLIVVFIVSLSVQSAFGQSNSDVLTNDNIVTMTKAGLSKSLILAKIQNSNTNFDTSTDAMISLKTKGVDDDVITAMVTKVKTGNVVSANSANIAGETKDQIKQSPWEQIKITLMSSTYFRISQVNGNETFDFKYQDGKRKTVDKGQQLVLQLDDNEAVMLTCPQNTISYLGGGSIGSLGDNSQGIQVSYPLSSEDIAKLKSHKVVKYGFNTKEGFIEWSISEKSANKIMVSLNLF